MAITRAQKGEVVEKLKKALKDAKSLIFVNFKGLSVSDTTAMRSALRSEGVSYLVTKKTLANQALDSHKFEGTKPELEGELALAWGEDLVAPARGIHSFQVKFPENLKIMGGVFEGKFKSAVEMIEIAKIPTLEVLRGKFVNIINSPIQRLVIGLNEISKTK